jgi:hypothetical protein
MSLLTYRHIVLLEEKRARMRAGLSQLLVAHLDVTASCTCGWANKNAAAYQEFLKNPTNGLLPTGLLNKSISDALETAHTAPTYTTSKRDLSCKDYNQVHSKQSAKVTLNKQLADFKKSLSGLELRTLRPAM